MINGKEAEFFGFLVHSYPDHKKNRLYFLGRLEDGRSFGAVEETWQPYIHLYEKDFLLLTESQPNSKSGALKMRGYDLNTFDFEKVPSAIETFSGSDKLIKLRFASFSGRSRAAAALQAASVPTVDGDIKPADLFLTEKQIRGPVMINGYAQPGKKVDIVIRHARIFAPPRTVTSPLRIASIDIETDTITGVIRAVGIAWTDAHNNTFADNTIQGRVRVLSRKAGLSNGVGLSDDVQLSNIDGHSNSAVLHPFTDSRRFVPNLPLFFHHDERSMLCAFIEDIRLIDPDVLTGWNFIDFDFPHLAGRFVKHKLPFTIGRSRDNAKFFPGEDGGYWRRRSAAAVVPGRQVLDALRVMRAGTVNRTVGQGFSLEEVALRVLGEGKTVNETGEEKIAALDKLYAEDIERFGEYCLRDAQLVLRILAKTGLFRLTMERASLTGVTLDKAWTSVVSFERIYAIQLVGRNIAPPPAVEGADVSGAAGGTVLESESGLFNNVAVFDFRSLYPTIIRTFNIDPLSHARAAVETAGKQKECIIAPNGAAFSGNAGVLPSLIGEYFAKRRLALESGDSIAAQVYKILMNSFYGVLGTSACRYGKTELAGAITSFARKWLLFSRDWFSSRGLRVLYGDTDSLFVETGFGDIILSEFEKRCAYLTDELNQLITRTVKKEYDLESFIELRFEKAYRRFLIPPLRNFHDDSGVEARGRAKGYGGYLLHKDGKASVEVIGMEAVRSDTTALARRLQLELLELVFAGGASSHNGEVTGCTEDEYRKKVEQTIHDLRSGKLDQELIYRKRLTRFPETYTSSTPPQVKAARALGWKKRRGTVEYVWTVNGPEPTVLAHAKPDYNHYVESQIFPLVRSIAAAAKWDAGFFVTRNDEGYAQMELEFV